MRKIILNKWDSLKFLILTVLLSLSACQTFTPMPPKYTVKFDESGWEMVDMQSLSNGYNKVFLPSLPALQDPKKEKLIIIYRSDKSANLPPLGPLQEEIDAARKLCKSSSHEIISKNANDVAAYGTGIGCKNDPYGESSWILKIFNRPDEQYGIMYSFHPSEVSKEKIARMKQAIVSSSLVKIDAQKPSPNME